MTHKAALLVLSRYTLDTFVKIGLGAEAGAIQEDHNRFAVAFDSVQTTLNRRHLYGVLSPLVELTSGYAGHLAYMNRFAETIIADLQEKVCVDGHHQDAP